MKRYRYDQIEKAEPNVTRYKLYKAKTKWVIRGVSSVAILFGIHEMGVNGVPQIVNPLTTTAHADTVADNSTSDLNALTDAGTTATDSNTVQATNSPVATTVATPVNPLLGVQNEGVNGVSQIANPLPEAGISPASSKSNDGAAATTDQSTGVATTPANNGAAVSSDNQAAGANENAASTDSQQASDANGSQNATSAKQVTDAEEFAANQKLDAKNEKLNKANVSQNATQEAKKVADAPYDAEKASVQQSAQSVVNDLQKVADEANKQAAANNQDRDVNDAAYSALQEHMAQEVSQINVALKAQSDTLPKDMTTEALGLTQANKILTNMRQELDVAKQMMAADRAGYDAQLVESAQSALKQVVLPSGTNAELDAYGDLIVSASNSTDYQSVVNQLQQSGLISNFRYVVDPTALDDGTEGYTAAQMLETAKNTALNSVLTVINPDLTMTTDPNSFHESPLFDAENITNYDIFAPYIKNLQNVYNSSSSTASDVIKAAALVQGAYNAYMNYNGGSIPRDDDQQQSSKNLSIALILNVDENGNPIFDASYGPTVKAGNILNKVGKVVDPTTGQMTHDFLSPVGDPGAVNDGTYYIGTVGNTIPNPTKDLKIPNFTYVSTEGPTKLESILGGKTMQLVINHWTSGSKPTTPTTTALKATVGDVSKTYDGSATFTTVPTVQLSGLTGVKTPTFATTDFDWSKVQAAAGTYAVTLNATGIKKVTDANANTTLTAADITAGKATIKPAAPKITALKAIVGDVSKTFDGNATFTTVPTVQLSGLTGVKTPTFVTSDFDWSKVQAAAGTYSVTLNAAGIKKVTDANANTTLAVADVTAGKATIKPAAPTTKALTATVKDISKTYDGTTTFSNLPSVTLSDNATVPTLTATDFDWSKVSKNAGTYSVTLNAAGIKKITDANANTSLATSAITAGKAVINKAPITITVTSQTKKQGDPDPELSILFTNTPSNGDKLVYTASREPGEEPGTYAIKVVASATDNPNYDLTIHNGTLTITAKVTALKAAVGNVSKTFDGTTTFTTLPKVTLSGLTNATVPTFTTTDFDWSNVQAAAGTYSVTLNAAGIKKVTDANANTTLVAADVTAGKATINPAAPTITALKAKVGDVSKNYDGNTNFNTVPSVQLTGLTGVKTPTFVTTDFDWSQVQATAGTYAVTLNAAGIKKVTDANANTTLAATDVTAGKATINPVTPTITALKAKVGDVSKTYDGTKNFTSVPTVSLSGLTNAVNPTFTASDFDWSNVQAAPGTYSVTLNAAGIKKVTDANTNTTLTAADVTAGKATINPAAPTITALKATVGNVSKIYDGNTTFTTLPKVNLSGLTNAVVPTFTASDFDWSNVQAAPGTYSVTLNAAGIKKVTDANANTTLAAADVTAGKATINPVTTTKTALTAKVGDVSKDYDGTATFTTVPKVTLGGLANAVDPTFTTSDFDWSKVQPAAGSYVITLNAAGIKKVTDANANTTLAATDVTAGKATINPAAPTITALAAKVGDVSKTYDGTKTFTTMPKVTVSGLTNASVPTFTATDFDWSNVQPAVGNYSVTLNAAGIKKITDANANTSLATANVTAGKAAINPVVLKAKVANISKTYDGTKTFTTMPVVALSGLTNATVPTFTATDFDWSNVQPAAGNYSVTLNAAGIKKITDANANTALEATDVTAGKATITPAALTAKVDDVSKDYDGTATFTTVPKVTLSGLTTTTVPTLTTSDFDWSNVKPDAGSYSVTLNAAGIKKITDANANTTLAATGVTAGKAVINKAAVTVTANNASKLAGNADPALTATVSGNPANGDQVKYTVSRDAGEAVGTYTIHVTANAADNPNYTITAKTGQFTIAKVAAKATVGNVSKTYDGTTTFNKGPVVSLDHGFTASDLTNADFDWSQVQANAGTYSVTLNATGIQKLLSDNPDMTLTAADVTAGQATIKKATVTVTANNASKVAGDADPALTATVGSKPAKGADVNYKVSRAAGENVGTYAITVTPTTNLNYNVEVKPGQFTITPQPADVAVGNVTKAYDGTTSFTDVPATTVTGAKEVKLPTLTASDFDWSNVQENVGSYQVSLNDAGKAKLQQLNPNINISKVTAGTATITPAKVTLQAKNATKVFGTNDPAFDATVTGQPAKGAKVAYKITRVAGENVGSYDLTVTPTAESNSNYQVTVTKGGQLTITPAATTAVISTVHKTYDGTTAKPSEALTVTLANGTVIDNLPSSDFDWSAVDANAGDYAVSLNAQGLQAIGQQQPNYTLAAKDVQAGHVIVDPAPVTITAPTITKDYDKQGYTGDLKATVTGQPADGVDLKYSLTDLSHDANIGVYPINVILGTNSNYDVKITTGKLTVKANNFALTTNYVDAKNNQLAAPTSTKNHNLGDAYKTEAKAITGYYLTAEPANAAGTFAGNATVNYVYAPVGSAIITMPNGEQTKIAYKVDGTDLTKVSVQTGQVVPYVKGYTAYAVNGGAKTALTPVNAKDVTAGYQLPALPKDPSQDTVITYVAETSTNGGNVTGGTTSGATTNTGTTPTGSSENQNGTLPTVKTDNQSGETETMPNSANHANGSTSEPGSQSTGTAETMGASQNAGQATNGAAANEAQGTTENANVAANNQQAPSVSGNASANSQRVAPEAVNTVTTKGEATSQKKQAIAKTTLPQTGETAKPSFASEVGVMLLGLFGLFGTSKKKRHE